MFLFIIIIIVVMSSSRIKRYRLVSPDRYKKLSKLEEKEEEEVRRLPPTRSPSPPARPRNNNDYNYYTNEDGNEKYEENHRHPIYETVSPSGCTGKPLR